MNEEKIKCEAQIPIPAVLRQFGAFFERAGFKAYLVGGAVRDMLMQRPVSDYDVGTDASPEDVMRIFKRVIPTGIEHGTVTVLFQTSHNSQVEKIEVTTFRSESAYTDGRHPDSITFCADIEADLSRRDFTINAIGVSLVSCEIGKIIDPFFGFLDIQKRIIRTVGNPLERFSEDYLRPIRAIRFSSTLDFTIEQKTLDAIKKISAQTEHISVERFRDEFEKMLVRSKKPSIALRLLLQCGILKIFIPELVMCSGVKQNDYRNYHKNDDDILEHLFFSVDAAYYTQSKTPEIKLAVLFHDIGKPATLLREENGKITFFAHEKKSAELTERILKRLKFPNRTIEYVCHLIANHMFHYESSWSDAAVRRFLVRVLQPAQMKEKNNSEVLQDLFSLHDADSNGRGKLLGESLPPDANISEFKMRIQKMLEKTGIEKPALSLKDIALNGNDLIALGIPSGKNIGEILQALHEKVIVNPELNTKESLMDVVKSEYSDRFYG